MKWIFCTLTSPHKQFHDVKAVVDWIKKRNLPQWKLISEMGSSGDSPHLHFIIPMTETMRIDNVKEPILRAYFGPDLAALRLMGGFNIHSYNAKTVNGIAQLKNICNYLKKEMIRSGTTPTHDYGDIDLHEITKGMVSFDEHTAIQNGKTVAYSMDKLLVMATEEYHAYLQESLTTMECYMGLKNDPRPPDKNDFKEIIMRLHKKEINLMNLYKNMKPFYINWLAQLGNYTAMERFIDKIDDDLNIRN